MWKNVFLESCILSALIFGGFYINATLLKDELYSEETRASSYLVHISGFTESLPAPKHISGHKTEKKISSHVSGRITAAKIPQ
tara:strand:- start:695 stop:943 length:249 start_codon:yes stop_codon:yes gene_type:complete